MNWNLLPLRRKITYIHLEVFDALNGDGQKDAHNDTDELQRHLEKKMKAKEAMRQQILTEQSNVQQYFGGLQFNHFVFLMVLGSISAVTAYAIDLTVFQINSSTNDYFILFSRKGTLGREQ